MASKRIHFVSLGCPKNQVDSEVMLGMAQKAGYSLTAEPGEADLLVVNTCSFIESAREESVGTILDLAEIRQNNPDTKLVVAGCLSQRYPEALQEELPEVDHFLGTGQIPEFEKLLGPKVEAPRDLASAAPGWLYSHNSPRMQSTPFYTAYVKIAEGCDRTCAFCAIPSFRGKQKSRTIDDIVQEVTTLSGRGVREINLIAQELNGYGRDLSIGKQDTTDLADLLLALDDIPNGPDWIRLHYMYPYRFSERLVDVIANSPRVLPYIDMPLQHISDPVLRKMRRAGNSDKIRGLLDQLRTAIPDLTIRTTFLVGFPGETDKDFQELADFLQEQRFDRVGIFSFSKEEGTSSFDMTPEVPEEVAEERRAYLYEMQAEISRSNLEEYLDKELTVLVEGVSEESEWLMEGRFAGQAPGIDGVVYINDGRPKPGEMVQVLIEQVGEHDLVGGVVSDD